MTMMIIIILDHNDVGDYDYNDDIIVLDHSHGVDHHYDDTYHGM